MTLMQRLERLIENKHSYLDYLASSSYMEPFIPSELSQYSKYIQIKKSPKGGYGVFAIRDIPYHTIILKECPIFTATNHDILEVIESLNLSDQIAFNSLHSYEALHHNRAIARFKTNRFALGQGISGVFFVASRFNHACKPCTTYDFRDDDRKICISATTDIKCGEEVTISYGQSPNDLASSWGFLCDCGNCDPPTKLPAQDPNEFWKKY